MELDFKIFTLNCWGIPFISKNLNERIEAIGDFLAKSDYDCVCLQELWTEKQYLEIKEKVSETLPFGHYFFSGTLGSGMCILSKYSIENVYFHQWPVNGYIHKIHHGDWFGGKGVGLCKLRVNKYLVNIYTTHLHAEYDRNNDEYKAHRIIQAFDTAQFIHLTSTSADLVLLAGDLNTEPGDLVYRLLLTVPGLTDAFEKAQISDEMKFATFENPTNSYTPSSLKKDGLCGKRIDYILFHPGSTLQIYLKKYEMPLLDKMAVPDRLSLSDDEPKERFSYSDHEAISAEFHINGDMITSPVRNSLKKISILEESKKVLEEEIENLRSNRGFYWLRCIFPFCLFLITIFVDVPSNFEIPYNIFRSFLAILTLFVIGMATIWNSIETNAVVASSLAMDILLKTLSHEK